MCVNAIDLWRWARAYAKRREDAGLGTRYPTMREATKRFHCTLDDVENVVGDDLGDENRYLGIAVALGTLGAGHANINHRSEQLVEAY